MKRRIRRHHGFCGIDTGQKLSFHTPIITSKSSMTTKPLTLLSKQGNNELETTNRSIFIFIASLTQADKTGVTERQSRQAGAIQAGCHGLADRDQTE